MYKINSKHKQNFRDKITSYKSNNDNNKLTLRAYLEFILVLIKSEYIDEEFRVYKPYTKIKEKEKKTTKTEKSCCSDKKAADKKSCSTTEKKSCCSKK